jgi:hypothetical protein
VIEEKFLEFKDSLKKNITSQFAESVKLETKDQVILEKEFDF